MKRVSQKLKKYLIPHEGNDHRPHLLRPRAVIFVCMLALIVESVFLFGSSYIIPRSKLFGVILVNALIDGTNHARITNNLSALRENPLLDAAAQEKANDMVTNNYFAHTSPSGLSPWYWFAKVGYNFTAAGENLAVNFSDSGDVTTAWLNSPEHRANILTAGYAEIGMATAQGEFQGHPAVFVAELFGTPSPVFALAPIAKAAPPSAPAPATKPALTPTIVAPNSTASATPEPIAVEVKGAEATVPPAVATTVGAPVAPVTIPVASPSAPAPTSHESWAQAIAASPRQAVDYVYFAIALLFAIALAISMSMKVHLVHPHLILGGMLVILVAGLFIVLNQHFGTASIVIL